MPSFLYYLLTFAKAITSVLGLRFAYEQPRYTVIQKLNHSVEIRRYEPQEAIEVTVSGADRQKDANEAFTLLFRYITGANQAEQKIAMTTPVRTDEPQRIAMTAPVQTMTSNGLTSMRFFLPRAVAQADAPAPLDPRLHLVKLPEITIAALRFSGVATQTKRDHQAAVLFSVLANSGWKPSGDVFQFDYDPPFTIPLFRRNELAVPVTR